MIYLDFAASTPVLPEVMEAMRPWFTDFYANPSSSHKVGRQASEAIEQARTTIADEIGAYPSEIIFTSGATESNNLAIKGIAWANRDKGRHIITSSIEHKCVLSICAYLERDGFEVTYIQPDHQGIIHPETLKETLRPDTILVSIHHVNNELGTIQPIEQLGTLCFDRGIPFHTDAAQSFGKLSIDVDDLNIDLMSISGHKIYGPKGIGALYIRNIRETKITPVIHGAGQELSLRGGTLATPSIVGFEKALSILKTEPYASKHQVIKSLNNFLLSEALKSGYKVNGSLTQKIPTISNLLIPSIEPNSFLTKNKHTLSISQGSACSSITIEPSYVLTNIGLDRASAEKSFRISLGLLNNQKDIQSFFSSLSKQQN